MRRTCYEGNEPPSWWLPCFDLSTEFNFFTKEVYRRAGLELPNHWIVKPAQGTRSIGHVVIVSIKPEDILRDSAEPVLKDTSTDRVAQLVVERPLLLNGRKFDLRLFVAVKSFVPLKGWPKFISLCT